MQPTQKAYMSMDGSKRPFLGAECLGQYRAASLRIVHKNPACAGIRRKSALTPAEAAISLREGDRAFSELACRHAGLEQSRADAEAIGAGAHVAGHGLERDAADWN